MAPKTRGPTSSIPPLRPRPRTATIPGPMIFKPLTFFAVAIAGWMNRRQQDAISYLKAENQILREKLGQKRILLSDAQ